MGRRVTKQVTYAVQFMPVNGRQAWDDHGARTPDLQRALNLYTQMRATFGISHRVRLVKTVTEHVILREG